MFTGGSQDMSLTQIYCISAERWRDLTLAPQWRLSICLMSLGFLAVAVKWLIDSIRNCPDKAEGYSIREERQRSQAKRLSLNHYLRSTTAQPEDMPLPIGQ
ncbi:hypothetical protein Pst134EA_013704 [Puccinia striiformis f. sp. tritici]|uniref:hypothetical protein n=1 Tax=Puccinia striiformis f. sp. tritici TaxID=168172 RepID=UPI002007CA22|nr:hypothetical protein Pst134EA_013704 [Puccinia striiformis f. sp. tritici]KAH9454592.1 hypothetical protein Pst134EB_014665 [Puccinia striiformis f. sp. tritici]KAH9465839.1 hypothetical protein Pst134EA_013704 [Puccinia striiformis f. sp. tritici]KAI9604086.1 hypothetical protein H4Q26_003698 [Puccinia striiformis f. sp. tritici PST-130]KAI9612814.1 hypothetical protein KEM48_004050 [Puccinia striiformis f. sp. tritici PST-130]